jgi:hypothetical protein
MAVRQRMQLTHWTTETWMVTFLVLIFAVALPVFLATYSANSISDRAMLEFVIGTWPNQTYDVSAKEFQTDIWLSIGVGLRTFVTFGIPAIFGVAFTLLLARVRKIERGLAMTLSQFIGARDAHFKTELYAEFRDVLRAADISNADEKCEEMVEEAFNRAAHEWNTAMSARFASAMERIVFSEEDTQQEDRH